MMSRQEIQNRIIEIGIQISLLEREKQDLHRQLNEMNSQQRPSDGTQQLLKG